MYYSYPCSYCHKFFYTFNNNKSNAAATLYAGIKAHLVSYDEDDKEHEFDDGATIDTQEVYSGMTESDSAPSGGYELK